MRNISYKLTAHSTTTTIDKDFDTPYTIENGNERWESENHLRDELDLIKKHCKETGELIKVEVEYEFNDPIIKGKRKGTVIFDGELSHWLNLL